MPPSPSVQITTDCQSALSLAAYTLRILPCLRCTLIALATLITFISVLRIASPTRLCRTMEACFNVTERIYHGSTITGLLSPYHADLEIADLFRRLQGRVSHIQERRLRNSAAPWVEIFEIFKGQSFVIVRCTWDIQILKIRLEVLRENRFRELLDINNSSNHAEASATKSAPDMRHTLLAMC
ncbi:hypothetical protein B0H11DRAFT_2196845, partial [Mycena galericulata]